MSPECFLKANTDATCFPTEKVEAYDTLTGISNRIPYLDYMNPNAITFTL